MSMEDLLALRARQLEKCHEDLEAIKEQDLPPCHLCLTSVL